MTWTSFTVEELLFGALVIVGLVYFEAVTTVMLLRQQGVLV